MTILNKLLHLFQYRKKQYIKVRINSNLIFNNYLSKDKKFIKANSGKIVEAKQISHYFYEIKNAKAKIFLLDFTKIES